MCIFFLHRNEYFQAQRILLKGMVDLNSVLHLTCTTYRLKLYSESNSVYTAGIFLLTIEFVCHIGA